MEAITGLRIIFSIILLVFVWQNSHWSVAICLTLNIIFCEVASDFIRKHKDKK